MGACVSTSRSTCSSKSNGEPVPLPCLGIGFCRQKRTKRTFSDPVATLQHLPSIPNRVFTNGKSRSSCIFTQQGRKGINQDAMIVWESKQNGSDQTCFKGNSMKSDVGDLDKDGSIEDKLNSLWREAFLKSYKAMDKELKSHPNLDCFCSGSTAITIVKQGSNLFMGYIGDSRAIMGSRDSNDSMVAVQLTVDLKPDLPREAERIKRCKGRVFALQDEPEVPREYGVISIPEFSHRTLTERDQFIVLASDGVWDVLSNEDVVEIVSSAPTRASAARILVDSAAREWKLKYPTSKMDDCAVVCLFLDGKMDSESDYDEQGFSSATLDQSNHSGNAAESDDGQKSEPCLQRNFTVRSAEETDTYGRQAVEADGDGEAMSAEDQNWLGLEGVTRVNSLVQLPRFSEERPDP
ncbi:PROTEIN PHOSPHATASE 2C 52-RELATED [Salix koriyanagi]|uniref:PROTEIN PHOSPHATASE 2C 52-RELATED n=1 Tax=Salix koriyanagi TaxID=2511006 RepID=A0A9Q0W7T0_9ROSI|nr:PROTEIN PHOSPHATASE 2C 52-RELATED [Salix koriyanagi]